MKALIISSLLFFSLRAMSSEVGESLKGECIYSSQSNKRETKVVNTPVSTEAVKSESKAISK